jgi:hypothetical protein
LQGFVARLVKADWLLAVVSVQEANAAGLDPEKVAQSLDEIAKGTAAAKAGRTENAIEHYQNAWKHAVRLQVKGGVLVNGGKVRLHFTALPGESYLVQASTNLVNWIELGTITADANGDIHFEDLNSAACPAKFYRAVFLEKR